ncbi:hypothetical protein D3C72_517920 [compost metagenome]
MTRKIKVISDLEYLIRTRMEECEDCEEVELGYVQWHSPDESGCNWNVPSFSGRRISVNQCYSAIESHVQDLRAQFNLPDPE